jgi:hypothetical protein
MCYFSVQTLLSTHILSRTPMMMIHEKLFSPVVLNGHGTQSLIMREEHVMSPVFGRKKF